MLIRITPRTAVVEHTVDGVRTAIPRAAWLLGIMALGFGLSEGTAVDWSALHVTDRRPGRHRDRSLGLVAVSGFMVLIRLLGDRLVNRFGRRAVVRFGGVTAARLLHRHPGRLPAPAAGRLGARRLRRWHDRAAGVRRRRDIGGGRVLAVVVTFGYAAF